MFASRIFLGQVFRRILHGKVHSINRRNTNRDRDSFERSVDTGNIALSHKNQHTIKYQKGSSSTKQIKFHAGNVQKQKELKKDATIITTCLEKVFF